MDREKYQVIIKARFFVVSALFSVFLLVLVIPVLDAWGGNLEVVKSFESPGDRPFGLAWDDKYLWHSDRTSGLIYTLDPEEEEIVHYITPPHVISDPAGLTRDGQYLWCADWSGGMIYKLKVNYLFLLVYPPPDDPASIWLSIEDSFASPASSPFGLAWDGEYLWCAEVFRGRIYKLGPENGSVVLSLELPFWPSGLTFDGTDLWVTGQQKVINGDKQIYRVSLSGKILDSYEPPGSDPEGLTWDGKYLWNCDIADDMIYQLLIIDEPFPTSLVYTSGNRQTGEINTPLPKPFVVQVRDQAGRPLEDVPVTFTVTQGGGLLTYTFEYMDQNGNGRWDSDEPYRLSGLPANLEDGEFAGITPGQPTATLSTLTTLTDSQGHANTTLTLGPEPGRNEVTVTCQDIAGAKIVFVADAVQPNAKTQANDDYYTIVQGEVLAVDADSGVLSNDTDMDEDQRLEAILVEYVSNGVLTLDSDGSFIYQPDPDFVGEDVFTYKANDGIADSNVAQVMITVTASGYHDDFEVIELGTVSVGDKLGDLQTHGWGPGTDDIEVIFREEYADFGKIVKMEPLTPGAGVGLHFPSTEEGGINLSGAAVQCFVLAHGLNSGVSFSDTFPAHGKDPSQYSYLRFIVTERERRSVLVTESSVDVPGFGEDFEDEFEFPIKQNEWYCFEFRFEPTEDESQFECQVLVNGRKVIEERVDIGPMYAKSMYADFVSSRGPLGNSETLFDNIGVCVRSDQFDFDPPLPGSIDIVEEYTNSTSVTVTLEAEDTVGGSGVAIFYIDGHVQDPVAKPWPSCDSDNPDHELCEGDTLKRYRYRSNNLLSPNDGMKWVHVIFADKGCRYSHKPGEEDWSRYPGDWIILDTRRPDANINPIPPINLGDTQEITGTAFDENFIGFMLQYQHEASSTWHIIPDLNKNTGATGIENGRLGSWTPTQASNYKIRLTVWDKADNSIFVDVTLQAPGPGITVSPASANFGNVTVGKPSQRSISIRNTGDAPLDVTDITSDLGDIMEISETSFNINPGETKYTTLVLTPLARGEISSKLVITSNDPDSPTEIPITALSEPVVDNILRIVVPEEARPGSRVTIKISITEAAGLTGGDIHIEYDDVRLVIDEVRGTDLISDLTFIINKDLPGKIVISMAGTGGVKPGSGVLFEIVMMVKSDAEAGKAAVFSFALAELYDPSGETIPIKLEDGTLKITQEIIKGDLNGDGRVRSNDAIIVLNIAAGLIEPTESQLYTGDMSGDGKIKANDAILILLKAAGLAASAKEYVAANTSRQNVISIARTHGVAGESIKIPLKVESTNYLAGGDICITYDSKVLRAIGVVSDLGKTLVSNLKQPGKVQIAFVDDGKLLSRTIAEVKFEVLTDNTSLLILRNAELYLPDGLPMKLIRTNGEFVSWAIPPENSALLQNFPNPFNPETWIPYQLRKGCDVTAQIFSASGDMIRSIRLGYKPAGRYISCDRSIYWNGKNEEGEDVASGVYFYTMQAGDHIWTRKMTILR